MADLLVWSPDIAWVDREGILTVALLPDGPVTTLTSADSVLGHMQDEFTVEGLISCVAKEQPAQVDDLETGIRQFVEDLQRAGLVVTAESAAD